MAYDDVQLRQRICRVLDANGIPYDTYFKGESAKLPYDMVAGVAYRNAVLALNALCFYGVNNGFGDIDDEIESLIDNSLQLCKVDVKQRKAAKCVDTIKKKIDSLSKLGIETGADGKVTFKRRVSLGIQKKMCEYIQETVEYTGVIINEILTSDEETFRSALSLSGISDPPKTFAVWQRDCKAVADKAVEILNSISEKISAVWDDSSQNAIKYAENMLDDIKRWRNNIVYSYLLLEKGMLEPLNDADKIATQWQNKLVGVVDSGKQRVARAENTAFFGEYKKDQLYYYVSCSRKRMSA